MKKSFIFLLLTVLCVGCVPKQNTGRDTIPYVKSILNNRNQREMQILSYASGYTVSGNIYVVGNASCVKKISTSILEYDRHDNASGATTSDLLPDFAGETICRVVDSTSRGIINYAAQGLEDDLRRKAVGLVLAALDTNAFVSQYDFQGMAVKVPAKMIILADATFSAYGKFDVDTLFRTVGCEVPVYAPLDVVFEKIFSKASGKAPSIGIIGWEEGVEYDIYSKVYKQYCHDYKLEQGNCVAYAAGDSTSGLKRFLDHCLEKGCAKPFDYIVVDRYNADVNAILEELSEFSSIMNRDYLKYGGFFNDGIKVLSSIGEMTEMCYGTLRSKNTFRHDIAFPDCLSYFYKYDHPDENRVRIILDLGVSQSL